MTTAKVFADDVTLNDADALIGNTQSGTEITTEAQPILSQNYPNPFVSTTTIEFSVLSPTHINLSVYDINGSLIRNLVNTTVPAGAHEATWDGCDAEGSRVAAGIYLYHIKTDNYSGLKTMIIVR